MYVPKWPTNGCPIVKEYDDNTTNKLYMSVVLKEKKDGRWGRRQGKNLEEHPTEHLSKYNLANFINFVNTQYMQTKDNKPAPFLLMCPVNQV